MSLPSMTSESYAVYGPHTLVTAECASDQAGKCEDARRVAHDGDA
jgi:hypothetical protein